MERQPAMINCKLYGIILDELRISINRFSYFLLLHRAAEIAYCKAGIFIICYVNSIRMLE